MVHSMTATISVLYIPQIDEENWKVFANCTWKPGSGEWEMNKRQIHEIFQMLRASTAHWFECFVTNRAGPRGRRDYLSGI